MADRIELIGVEAFGHHGVFSQEKDAGQKFIVDMVVWTDFRAAADSDALEDTINYVQLADIAVNAVEGKGAQGTQGAQSQQSQPQSHDLIETLASRIADEIAELGGVYAVEVTVHKPEAPIAHPFADVRVVARRSKR
ncbi:dihydroneopterin aldolase [Corynebacterium sp. HMSC058E07]|uniref:dihydroneopterin aldolase n=1 Tax=Corynebacterium sp. HMSC058E07 TaxID=1715157 RepID=UPI00054E0D7B|nr:dihydroneopterin aldolase [Corynebacterium sp. HMSC058E07]OFM55153.1 dihydroneopterin aldolase [Corynebacterium sp. HMSC058E07]